MHSCMTRPIGFVPVRVGRDVVSVAVEAELNAETHFDLLATGAKIIVREGLSPELANREVETVLPELQRLLARKLLN